MQSFAIKTSNLCLAIAVMSSGIPVATAGIVGWGGDVSGPWTATAGDDFRHNRTEHNSATLVLREKTNAVLPNVRYNAHNPGKYQTPSDLVNAVIPGGGTAKMNSYLFHFDPTNGISQRESHGYVDFDNEIYVIARNDHLRDSDASLGVPGVRYPSGSALIADRGFDLVQRDEFEIINLGGNSRRLQFDVFARTGMDQLRVVEVLPVPEPSTAILSLSSLAGLALVRRRRAS